MEAYEECSIEVVAFVGVVEAFPGGVGSPEDGVDLGVTEIAFPIEIGVGVGEGAAEIEVWVAEEFIVSCSKAEGAGIEACELSGVIAVLEVHERLEPKTFFASGRIVVAEIRGMRTNEIKDILRHFLG